MAQTPISASVEVLKGTTTLYTVPSGKTAIIKAVLGGSVVGNTPQYTVNKVSGGITYPIVVNQAVNQVQATGGTTINNANLLQAPVTLVAGESITVYTGTADSLQIPQIASYTNTSSFTYYINQIIYANSVFMAIGYFGVNSALVLTSSDGVTWTKQNLASTVPRFLSVAYGNSDWVAIPNSTNNILYVSSDNGVTWSSVNVTASAGAQCQSVAYVNSLWVSVWNPNSMYTTTTPATAGWTNNTAYSAYTKSSGAGGLITAIGHNGTNYIFTGYLSGVIYSTDLATFTSYGNVGGGYYMQNYAEAVGIGYSSTYSKWYTNIRQSSVTDSVYSSTDSVNWTRLTVPAYSSSGPIQIAGSNTVLLIQNTNGTGGSGASSAYLKSTDGVTWATATDIGSRTGPLVGLSNGYFVKFTNTSDSRYNLSTDPSTINGTLQATSSPFSACNVGASDGTKWIVFGYNPSNSFISHVGGTSGTNAQNVFNDGTYDVNGYGYPSSACWNPANGYFYMITKYGVIFRLTQRGNALEYVTQIGNSTDTFYGIAYLNGFMYATSSRTTSTRNKIYIATDYITFNEFNLGGTTFNAYGAEKTDLSSYNYASNNFAVNGTTSLCIASRYGWTYNLNASDPYTPYYYPQGVQHYERVNSIDVFAGGQDISSNTLYGLWQYPSGFTTSPQPIVTGVSFTGGSAKWNINDYFVYMGSTYYALDSNGSVYSGSSLVTLANVTFSSSSPNGVSYTGQAVATIQNNGSDFYYLPAQNLATNASMQLGKTSNLADSINNSVMTGSIIQID